MDGHEDRNGTGKMAVEKDDFAPVSRTCWNKSRHVPRVYQRRRRPEGRFPSKENSSPGKEDEAGAVLRAKDSNSNPAQLHPQKLTNRADPASNQATAPAYRAPACRR